MTYPTAIVVAAFILAGTVLLSGTTGSQTAFGEKVESISASNDGQAWGLTTYNRVVNCRLAGAPPVVRCNTSQGAADIPY